MPGWWQPGIEIEFVQIELAALEGDLIEQASALGGAKAAVGRAPRRPSS